MSRTTRRRCRWYHTVRPRPPAGIVDRWACCSCTSWTAGRTGTRVPWRPPWRAATPPWTGRPPPPVGFCVSRGSAVPCVTETEETVGRYKRYCNNNDNNHSDVIVVVVSLWSCSKRTGKRWRRHGTTARTTRAGHRSWTAYGRRHDWHGTTAILVVGRTRAKTRRARWPICFKIRNTLTRARTRRGRKTQWPSGKPGRQIISAGTIEKHEQRYYYITYIFAQSRRRRRRRRRDICLSPLFPFPPPTAPHPRTAAHPGPPPSSLTRETPAGSLSSTHKRQ